MSCRLTQVTPPRQYHQVAFGVFFKCVGSMLGRGALEAALCHFPAMPGQSRVLRFSGSRLSPSGLGSSLGHSGLMNLRRLLSVLPCGSDCLHACSHSCTPCPHSCSRLWRNPRGPCTRSAQVLPVALVRGSWWWLFGRLQATGFGRGFDSLTLA